ncbi:sperm-associated antigen 1 [Ochlerotatus camptorhynchus]|uniref:sperm-associated antigen 1 n=1 Tax=Ochlerotatus camptorhynchus TaxID=644619 RepID=UPI0031E3F16F
MSNKPKTLLEQYDVLLEHLDYGYIGKCADGRMLEKIVKILRSGQEGHYPDLTSFAEHRLRSIKPNSKLFREETPLITKESITRERWQKINQDLEEWESNMQKVHKDILDQKGIPIEDVPPIRSMHAAINTSYASESSVSQRIKSWDYNNWDRYDADAEILKMDLDEERHKEFVMKQNESNPSGNIIQEDQSNEIDRLSETERKVLATKYKEKGNDFFRSKEYEQALQEYNRSITIFPTAACFNNRAITNIKLTRYNKAISDCEACLKSEPKNLKALCRKAEALKLDNKCREAYQALSQVLLVDRNNKLALEAVDDLRRQHPDLPPPNAFQVKIEDVGNEDVAVDDDYATLIKPKRIVKDKLPDAMKSLRTETAKMMQKSVSTKIQNDKIEIIPRPGKKVFIEEIK